MNKAKVDLRERTTNFALGVVRMFAKLPKTTEAQVLGRQLLRSGTSVGANHREAYRGRSRAEFIAKCGDCLCEIEEAAYWLELLVAADIASFDDLNSGVKNAMSSRLFLLASSNNPKLRQRNLNSNFLTLNWSQ